MKSPNKPVNSLKLINFQVFADQKSIVSDVDLEMYSSELHVIVGPNGSGKSSLLLGMGGHPNYQTTGKILINNKNISTFSSNQRVKSGIMMTFQNPTGITGITIKHLLKTAYREIYPQEEFNLSVFYQNLTNESKKLNIKETLLKRDLNIDFSGGEKKLMELLSILILKPNFVLLDEIDTGLDFDALKLVATVVNRLQQMGVGILLITHQFKLIKLLTFQRLYVMKQGKIIKSGNNELLDKISQTGFEKI